MGGKPGYLSGKESKTPDGASTRVTGKNGLKKKKSQLRIQRCWKSREKKFFRGVKNIAERKSPSKPQMGDRTPHGHQHQKNRQDSTKPALAKGNGFCVGGST